MRIGWLIDGGMFDGYRDELLAAIRDQGHEAKLIHAPSPPFRWDDVGCSYRETFPEDWCIIWATAMGEATESGCQARIVLTYVAARQAQSV